MVADPSTAFQVKLLFLFHVPAIANPPVHADDYALSVLVFTLADQNDCFSGSWIELPVSTLRGPGAYGAAATVVQSQQGSAFIFLFGGISSQGISNAVLTMSLTQDATIVPYLNLEQTPPARYNALVVSFPSMQGSVWMYGGATFLHAYDDNWLFPAGVPGVCFPISIPTTPNARFFASAAMVNNKLFLFGGINGAGVVLDDLWVLDPAVNRWNSPVSDFIPDVWGSPAVSTGDGFIAFGGFNSIRCTKKLVTMCGDLTQILRWDSAQLPSGRALHATALSFFNATHSQLVCKLP